MISASAVTANKRLRRSSSKNCSSLMRLHFCTYDDISLWPGAEVQVATSKGWTWQDTYRSGEKLDSGSRKAAFDYWDRLVNGSFHFLPMTGKGRLHSVATGCFRELEFNDRFPAMNPKR